MPKTMLIDAYHPEETRVALLQGGKVEDFDFEYASRKPLRGNIYLARVTRVEPSLQAAFIEYGGNRHGFLAFGEIHPDYYQIPVADREVLRKAEALEVELAQKLAELNDDDDADDIDPDEDELRASADAGDIAAEAAGAEPLTDDTADDEAPETDASASGDASAAKPSTNDGEALPDDYDAEAAEQDSGEWHGADADLIDAVEEPVVIITDDQAPRAADGVTKRTAEEEDEEEERDTADEADEADGADEVEASADPSSAGDETEGTEEPIAKRYVPQKSNAAQSKAKADNAQSAQKEIQRLRARYEDAKRDRNRLLRAYKIQEVIKRRQIMLVQVVKEERGNKGAALTTYLSLAGRYGVLMPNTARGGGISRKITNQSDRKRLKKAMKDLEIAPNMGLIIRTAGAKRTKTEIKRDYDYLSRLWSQIREKTLESVAPTLIYEEASLMKRAIRDLYDKDTETIIVHGQDGYREAKDFMKMLMPSHAKHVRQHKGDTPLFLKHQVEEQLDKMYQPVVQLKSGGYLVIQQTEALVSIDVNSGKATKERNVEQTALKTNSEAAVEVARQCRLRDLAGLIVIDFIDMEENRNNRAVEKKLKDAIKNDRARTQIGSISSFGLLEMSRQRRRSGIVDGTTQICPVCQGAGAVRSHEMAALRILRAAEGQAATGKHGLITVKTSMDVALYILNTKRDWLERMEKLYGVKANILADATKFGDQYEVATSGSPSESISLKDAIGEDGPLSDLDAPELDNSDDDQEAEKATADAEDKPKKKRRRRRRRGRGEDGENQDASGAADHEAGNGSGEAQETEQKADENGEEPSGAQAGGAERSDNAEDDDGEPKKRRRRGRRGGRRNRRKDSESEAGNANDNKDGEPQDDAGKQNGEPQEPAAASADETSKIEDKAVNEAPPQAETSRDETADDEPLTPETPREEVAAETSPEPEPVSAPQPVEAEPVVAASKASPPQEEPQASDRAKPRRGGWWQRALNKS